MVRRGRYGRLRFDGPQLGFGRRLHLHARAERVVHARLSARDRWCDGDVWSALRNCLTLLAGAVCDSGAVLLHAGVADIFRKVGGRLRYLRQYPPRGYLLLRQFITAFLHCFSACSPKNRESPPGHGDRHGPDDRILCAASPQRCGAPATSGRKCC